MKKRCYLYILTAFAIGGMGWYAHQSTEQAELLVCHPPMNEIEVNWSALNRDNVNHQLDFGGGITSASPIVYAVRQNRADMVKRCIELGADLEARAGVEYFGPHSHTPLHVAVESGNLDIVRMLVQAGADLESRIRRNVLAMVPGYTPLMWAVHLGKTDVARYLLEQGADATAVSEPWWLVECGCPEESVLQVAQAHADCFELVHDYLRRTQLNRLLNPSFAWGNLNLPEPELQKNISFYHGADADLCVEMSQAELLRYLNSCYCILKIRTVTDYISDEWQGEHETIRNFAVDEVLYCKEPMRNPKCVMLFIPRKVVDATADDKEIPVEDTYICLKKESFTRLEDLLYINYCEAWNDLWCISGKKVTELMNLVLKR